MHPSGGVDVHFPELADRCVKVHTVPNGSDQVSFDMVAVFSDIS